MRPAACMSLVIFGGDGARLLVMTHSPYDRLQNDKASPTYDDGVLRVYSKWLVTKQDEGWDILVLHGAMSAEIRRRRARNPMFTFQPDGVHPDETGHWSMATLLIKHFGDRYAARTQPLRNDARHMGRGDAAGPGADVHSPRRMADRNRMSTPIRARRIAARASTRQIWRTDS